MKSVYFGVLLFVLINGCASASYPLKEASTAPIKGCLYLSNITGMSSLDTRSAANGVHRARRSAVEQAVEMGATHIVWLSTTRGHTSTASAYVYRCNSEA